MKTMHKPSYSEQWSILKAALIALDAFAIWASLTVAYSVRISSGAFEYFGPRDPDAYGVLVVASIPIWLAVFALFGLYRRDVLLGGFTEYQQVVKAATGGILVIVLLSFFWREEVVVSRVWLLLSWLLSCFTVSFVRFVVRRLVSRLQHRGWFTARVIIVGANEQGVSIARQWKRAHHSGMHVVGFADDFKPLGTPVADELEVIGRPSRLTELARAMSADEIILLPNAVARETFEEIIAQSSAQRSYTLRLSPGFFELLTTGVVATNKTFVPLFTINEARIIGFDAILKGAADIVLGMLTLLLLSPLILVIALSLKWTRHSIPVLQRFDVIGQSGTRFTMRKFNVRQLPDGSLAHDPSKFERWLRHSGLDKLPQLFNVVARQMSIVGPRPRILEEHEDTAHTIQHLQSVKPGVIGPWLVRMLWSTFDEAQDDLYYVRNWTIWLDTQIMLQTFVQMLVLGRDRAVQDRVEAGITADSSAIPKYSHTIATEIKVHTIKGDQYP